MAEMALGYGSEYQLLRFLGHHRNYLNAQIKTALGVEGDEIKWLDYPCDNKRVSLDGEHKGIECFRHEEKYPHIEAAWEDFWPQSGSAQNWDGIFRVGETWYFVEAKAHESETKSSCGASGASKEKIKTAFEKTIHAFHSCKNADYWVSKNCKSYQLANRLAFITFCKSCGIKAKLLYINFINGFDKPCTRGKENVETADAWKEIWKCEYEDLGIEKKILQDVLFHVYIDCTAQDF